MLAESEFQFISRPHISLSCPLTRLYQTSLACDHTFYLHDGSYYHLLEVHTHVNSLHNSIWLPTGSVVSQPDAKRDGMKDELYSGVSESRADWIWGLLSAISLMSFFLCLFLSRERFLIWGSEGRVRQGPNEQQPAGMVWTATQGNRRRGRYRGSLRTFGNQMRSAIVSCWARIKTSSLGLFLQTQSQHGHRLSQLKHFTWLDL